MKSTIWPALPSEIAVFKATTIQHDGKERKVVIKFGCVDARKIAYEENSAPKLWFCDKVASVGVGLFVVVMDLSRVGPFMPGRPFRNKLLGNSGRHSPHCIE